MKTILHLKKSIIIPLLFLFAGNVWGQPSAQDVITDLNSQIGQCIDMDNAYGCQCVDLAKYVCITYWGQNIVGNANQLDELNRWPAGTIKINYYAGFIPQQGDFYIWDNYGANGHIGLINTANVTSYTSLDENFVNPSSNGSPLANVNHSNYNNVTCVMRLPYSSCPSIPNTTTPSNAQTNVGIPVFFNWDDATGTNPQYRIQVSTVNSGWTSSSGFTTSTTPSGNIKVNINTLSDSFYSWSQYQSTDNPYTPQPYTTYYYSVKAFACGQNSSWSSVKSFTTGCSASTPVLLSPTNGQINVSNPVNFDWQDDNGTSPQYRIQVSTSSSGWTLQDGFTTSTSPIGNVVVNINTSNISSYQWNGALNSTTYYWTVRTNSCNNNSSYSPVRSFTVGNSIPCNAPSVTLTTPNNNLTITQGDNIYLSWQGIENGCPITEYMLYLDGPGTDPPAEQLTSNTSAGPATTTTWLTGTYIWGVKAKNSQGIWGNYNYRTFFINSQSSNYIITTTSNPTIGGSTSGDGTFNNGNSCYITATPNTGYTFINWTENGVLFSTNQNLTFTVTGNKNLVANFSQNQTGTCVSCPTYDFSTSINSSWGNHSSSILSNGCKIYRFLAVPGKTYTFKTACNDGATATFDTILELFDTNCNLMTTNDDACVSYQSIITWSCTYPTQNWVYLKLKGYQTAFGNYTLAYNETQSLSNNEKEILSKGISIYPNPSKDMINIETDNNEINSISIIDNLGRIIKTENVNNSKYKLNIQDLSNAIYLMEIKTDNGIKTEKIIKQ